MKKIVINQDCTCMLSWVAKYAKEGTLTPRDFVEFPKQFKGSQVTDYVINVDSAYPSDVRGGFLHKYHQKIENGKPVDYSENRMAFAAHYIFEVMGIDHIAIMINGFREIGINPWISFRMNDIHGLREETSMAKSDFFHAHPETRRVKFHPEYTYTDADHAYDYTHESVREHYLAYIEESLDRYDAYGVELDFQRECEIFAEGYAYDGIELLNDFMRKARALTKKYAEKYGHEIKLSARILPDIQNNLDFGLNVMQWVKEGLVDTLILTGRFESTDMDMPINLWKTLLEPYNVELLAGVDQMMRPYPTHKPIFCNIENHAASAASAYSQGADGIYFYNFFHVNLHDRMTPDLKFCFDPEKGFINADVYWTVINTLGDPEAVQKINRHHVVTYKDRTPFWKRYCNGGQQLPQTFWRQGGFKIHTGEIPKGARAIIRFSVENDLLLDAIPQVFVNSEECKYIENIKDTRLSENTLMCFEIPQSAYRQIACSYIIVSKTVTMNYSDIKIIVNE